MKKAFLLINGNPPKVLPNMKDYSKIYCTDGAYAHLLGKRIRPDFVIGDFDSISEEDISPRVEVVKKIDQDFTDFHKCLDVIVQDGFSDVDVYGSTGSEHDHFLGNLTTALGFKSRLNIVFIDDYAKFFFTEKETKISNVKDRVISLYPFPKADKVVSNGLFYPLNRMDLDITRRIGTRNHAIQDNVQINYEDGELLLFVSEYILDKDEITYKTKIN